MKLKIAAIFAILLTALMLLAQDTAQIFSELQPTSREPARRELVEPVAPVVEPVAAPVVVSAEPARREPAVVEAAPESVAPAVVEAIPVAAAPVVVEAAPVVTTPAAAPVVMSAAPAVVEAAPVAKTASTPEDVVETVIVSAEPATGGTIKAGLISVSLKEVELSNVIRLFATLSDANIIIPELESGAGVLKVDVNLKEVEWKPALQSILETQGFELYEKTPGTAVYSVRKKPTDAPTMMNIKIFKLNYASVSNVYDMIRSIVPEKGPLEGKISTFPSRNTIIVQSTPENLMDIQSMISAVDLPRQQVFIEAKIMELSDVASKQLGIDWQMLGGYDSDGKPSGYGVGLTKIGGTYNTLNSQKDGTDNSRSYTVNRYTDIAGRPYESGAGVDSAARPGSFGADDTRVNGITPTTLDGLVNKVTSVNEDTVTRTLGATLSASDFKLVLAALKEINGVKIVSNPKVIVANEERAKMEVVRKEPNIKQDTTQAQQADAVTTFSLDPSLPFFRYGITLDVTPVINTSSNITVAIEPTISRFVRPKTIVGSASGNSFPVTDEKTIKTIFSLESGQTAAIGGLTELDSNDTERKIPLLGSLPLIGRLFSYSSTKEEQRETVVFVTVGLANPDNINVDTGLPQDSTLAMRQDAAMRGDRQIRVQKQKLVETQESERAQAEIQKLQNAEQKRLEKKNK
ncbi:MAG: secretin N-terminal domain-containing protein [Kiritimatiellales bacterium]